ncbi:MAG: malate:quinone oxidoreductase [Synechococcus sp. SB0673_bin_10]|nr:malate:quinone oxidoreductase [Synechococcus sp. SB0667_bin_8]MYG63864.1 malate:quinone oxidoreductase [Synechococcus sp. SB0675_bin_7]MYI71659.1 malate:quinone oxidoreductase [Synechococcus sp. SB0673_bin_10]MYK86130.1 malate:quinone oxidoreductase [Synechococcus sp. SB0669_bin_7]
MVGTILPFVKELWSESRRMPSWWEQASWAPPWRLATLLQQLEPGLTVLIVERLGQVAAKAATFHWFSTKHMDRYVSTLPGAPTSAPLIRQIKWAGLPGTYAGNGSATGTLLPEAKFGKG